MLSCSPARYSCSWPAYINGGNESLQPFAKFIDYGCNGWRNWDDIREDPILTALPGTTCSL